jgi:hypothetical protein
MSFSTVVSFGLTSAPQYYWRYAFAPSLLEGDLTPILFCTVPVNMGYNSVIKANTYKI